MRSTWRPGDEIVYLSPDSSGRLVEGRLPKVVPGRRLVLKCRWLGDPELEADGPDREMFEIEEMDEICKLTAMFDRIEPGSPHMGGAT